MISFKHTKYALRKSVFFNVAGKADKRTSVVSLKARDIEITSWLVSAYDFYSLVVKNRKLTRSLRSQVRLRFFTTRE